MSGTAWKVNTRAWTGGARENHRLAGAALDGVVAAISAGGATFDRRALAETPVQIAWC
jgi:hypothetical protein